MFAKVVARQGLKETFLHRYRKNHRAAEAWTRLVHLRTVLEGNPFWGDQIPKARFPRRFRDEKNLWRVELPAGFRALYTVLNRPGAALLVAILWVGDHKEYDDLFGYATS